MHKLVIGRPTFAAVIFLALAHFLEPQFVAAQAPQPTESVNVLDANSAVVATLSVPRSGIQSSEIAVLINDNDPQSVEIANYYQRARNIPDRNMIHLNFDQNKLYPSFTVNQGIDPADFAHSQSAGGQSSRSRNSGVRHLVEQAVSYREFQLLFHQLFHHERLYLWNRRRSPHEQQLWRHAGESLLRLSVDKTIHRVWYSTIHDARWCKRDERRRQPSTTD